MTNIAHRLDLDRLLCQDGFVRSVARGLVLDENTVDDVVQETFLRALRGGPSQGGSLAGWLRTVARNVARSIRRREESRERRHAQAAGPPPTPWPEEILEREELRRQVVEAVFSLDEPYRTVVLLRHFEELTPEEIAGRLALPVRTVWTRLLRARSMLKTKLARGNRGDEGWRRGLLCLAGVDAKAIVASGATAALGMKLIWAAAIVLVTAGLVPAFLVDPSEDPLDSQASATLPAADRHEGGERHGGQDGGGPGAERVALTGTVQGDLESAISCRVIDPSGEPVGHALAMGRTDRNEPWLEMGRADSAGLVRIEWDDLALLDLEFRADGYVPVVRESLARGDSCDVILRRGVKVRGEVVDAESERPIVGATVGARFERFAGSVGTQTDTSGRFELILPGFCASLSINHENYAQWSEGPFLSDPDQETRKIRLSTLLETNPTYVRVLDRVTEQPLERVETSPYPASPLGGGMVETRCLSRGDSKVFDLRSPGYVGIKVTCDEEEGGSPERPLVLEMSRKVTVTGRVEDPRGNPVAGVSVRRRAKTVRNGAQWPDLPYDQTVLTDSGGRFELRDLPPSNIADYGLVLSHPDFADLTVGRVTVPETTRHELAPYRLSLGRGIRGTVRRADDHSAIAGARVQCGSRAVLSGEDGTFCLDHLTGFVNLVVHAAGMVPCTLNISTDESASDLEVMLESGLSISGIVLDADDCPATGAAVRAVLEKSEARDLNSNGLLREEGILAWADTGGRFRIDGLAEGTYGLIAGQFGAPSAGRGMKAYTTLAVAGDEDVQVRLEALSGIVMKLVSARTGRPVCRYAYRVEYCGGLWNRGALGKGGIAASNSFFEVLSPGGIANLAVEAPGYAPFVMTGIRVGEGEIREIEVMLEDPSSLTGVVRDEMGRPLADVALHLSMERMIFRDSEALERTALSDEQGRYQFNGLGGGEWTIQRAEVGRQGETLARSIRVHPDRFTVGVSTSATADLIAESPRGATLFGQVTPKPGERITSLLVMLWRAEEGNHPYAIAPIDEDGRYSIPFLPPGQYTLGASISEVYEGGTRSHENVGIRLVDVPESGEVEADLDISRLRQSR
ncbi:MAG: sigma-70 family RNA polymerase sigma factor [Planctomycetota bacterium]